MAKLLKSNEIYSKVVDLINDEDDALVLVSPYVSLTGTILSALQLRQKKYLSTVLICRKGDLKDDVKSLLQGIDYLKLYECANLHSKVYINSNEALVCSMNLYGASINNNHELGIWVDNSDVLYDDIYKEVGNLRKLSSEIAKGKKPLFSGLLPSKKEPKGYCIRTGKEIPFNPEKPFSADAFKAWSKYANHEFPEKYCHFSGEPSNGQTCFSKPILRKNWNKIK